MAESKGTLMEKIVSLCKRRGFVFPSSEIYGGFAATYDFGPLGFLLKKNIEKVWRHGMWSAAKIWWRSRARFFCIRRYGKRPGMWVVSRICLVEDLVTHKRFRADHLIEDAKILENAGALKVEEVDVVVKEYGLKSPDGNPLSSAKRFNLLVKTHLGPVEDAIDCCLSERRELSEYLC